MQHDQAPPESARAGAEVEGAGVANAAVSSAAARQINSLLQRHHPIFLSAVKPAALPQLTVQPLVVCLCQSARWYLGGILVVISEVGPQEHLRQTMFLAANVLNTMTRLRQIPLL